MGKHRKPGTPAPECQYGIHYGMSEKRGNAWFCSKCDGCTGVAHTTPNTAKVEHLVCYCNTSWSSILPPPPCPYHSPSATTNAFVTTTSTSPPWLFGLPTPEADDAA